jgi:tol-pal system protein YbgF
VRRLAVLAGTVALGACALKGDVRRVEAEVGALRAESARADSARALLLDEILAFQHRTLDSLNLLQHRLTAMQGDMRSDMTEVQRQLVQIQELTGQSQQRISELRAQVERRLQEDRLTGAGDTAAVGGIPAQEIYDISLQQLRRGSPQTARQGFHQFLEQYRGHPLSADAQFFIGESWEASNPDSAAAAYEEVVRTYRDSPRAPTALYRLGLLAERRGDQHAAEIYFQRVITGYPRSDEAQLARTKIPNPDR